MTKLAKEHDIYPGGSLTRLATEPYVDAHSGPPPFDPLTDLASYIDIWLEADKTSEANGATVNTWPDAGPHGRNAVKVTGTGATKVSAGLGGKPVLRFTNGQGYDAGLLDLSARNSVELLYIGFQNDAGNTVALEHGTDNNSDIAVHASGSNRGMDMHLRGNAGNNAVSVSSAGVAYSFLASILFDKSRTYYETSARFYQSGRRIIPFVGNVNNTDNLQSQHLYIGARSGSGVAWNGDWALIAFMSPLTDDLRDSLVKWAKAKYSFVD